MNARNPRWEVRDENGTYSTVHAASGVGAVAGLSGATRHNWVTNADGSLTVTARSGDGKNLKSYVVNGPV